MKRRSNFISLLLGLIATTLLPQLHAYELRRKSRSSTDLVNGPRIVQPVGEPNNKGTFRLSTWPVATLRTAGNCTNWQQLAGDQVWTSPCAIGYKGNGSTLELIRGSFKVIKEYYMHNDDYYMKFIDSQIHRVVPLGASSFLTSRYVSYIITELLRTHTSENPVIRQLVKLLGAYPTISCRNLNENNGLQTFDTDRWAPGTPGYKNTRAMSYAIVRDVFVNLIFA